MNNNAQVNMEKICSETKYPHDSTLTKRFVVEITVERSQFRKFLIGWNP